HVVGTRAHDLVEQGPGLNRDDEQQDKRREHVDEALQFRPDIGVNEVDRDVSAPVRGGGDAPEDQDAQKEPSEVVAVGNLDAEEVSQQDRGEDVGGDDADKERGSSSIPSMKRSMRPRLTTRSGFDWASAMMRSAVPWIDVCAVEHARERAATSSTAQAGYPPAEAPARRFCRCLHRLDRRCVGWAKSPAQERPLALTARAILPTPTDPVGIARIQ